MKATDRLSKLFTTPWLWGMTTAEASAAKEAQGLPQLRIVLGSPMKVMCMSATEIIRAARDKFNDENGLQADESDPAPTSNMLLKYVQTVEAADWAPIQDERDNQKCPVEVFHGFLPTDSLLYVPGGWCVALEVCASGGNDTATNGYGLRMAVPADENDSYAHTQMKAVADVMAADIDLANSVQTASLAKLCAAAQRDKNILDAILGCF
eukprot:93222-Pyramimonas_sp.AAC.1